MKKNILLSFLFMACLITIAHAQQTDQVGNSEAQVTQLNFLGKTQPLRNKTPQTNVLEGNQSIKKRKKKSYLEMPNFNRNKVMETPMADVALPKGGDPILQSVLNKDLTVVGPQLVFEGMDEMDSNIFPPDPAGDVSPLHYIQAVNANNGAIYTIHEKDGTPIFGPSSMADFWSLFGETGLGDPIVLWDHDAERWIISELGNSFNNMLIAVSETSDPLGSYYSYEFVAPGLPDYPKYGVWKDSYFITTNEFSDTFIPIYALDKAAMLAGDSDAQALRLPGVEKFGDPNAFQVATPADWEGATPPPAGSPHYSVRIHDDAWGSGEDRIEVWSTSVDWSDPTGAVVTGPIEIPLAAFDATLCDGGIFNCIAQPDGTLLSALQQVVMYRVPYRNFGTHETLLLNFSVDVNGANKAGIRWVELRKTATTDWALYQEGTWSPDEDGYFMASLAMDGSGNILMGYSVTGEISEPSLRFTGRLANDPLGEMTIDEYEFADGGSINFASRWGDYANMVIDPADDNTFWFTGEYMTDGGTWSTKIMNTFLRRDTHDIGVQSIIMPQSSGYLTDNEELTVAIRNYGYEDESDFTVSYSVNGGAVVTENYVGTIEVDSTKSFTFDATVNMEALGDYEFEIYTTHLPDTAFFNDTLRFVVSQLPRNDAALTSLLGAEFGVCAENFVGEIVLKNEGVDELTSAQIGWSVNGGVVETINWTGSLASGASVNIPITAIEVIDGVNTLSAVVSLPNGEIDQNEDNNELNREFTMILEGVELEMRITTDTYPFETTWDLLDDTGATVASGGPYSEPTLYVEPLCIADACYTLRVFDSFGDGIFEPGGYELVRVSSGEVLVEMQAANFGLEEITDFCTIIECALDATFTIEDATEEGLNDGSVLIDMENGTPPYQYSIDNGATWIGVPLFSDLAPDTYTILVEDANECTYEGTVTVGVMVGLANVDNEVRIEVSPNPTDGLFKIDVYGAADRYDLSAQVIDLQGRILKEYQLGNFNGVQTSILSLVPYPSGVYLIRVQDERFTHLARIVKE